MEKIEIKTTHAEFMVLASDIPLGLQILKEAAIIWEDSNGRRKSPEIMVVTPANFMRKMMCHRPKIVVKLEGWHKYCDFEMVENIVTELNMMQSRNNNMIVAFVNIYDIKEIRRLATEEVI